MTNYIYIYLKRKKRKDIEKQTLYTVYKLYK